MMPIHRNFLKHKLILVYVLVFSLSACTKLPLKPSLEKPGKQQKAPGIVKGKIKEERPKISIVEILSAQAKKFSLQGNYQDALFAYNQALSQASDIEKSQIISAIEQVLAKTPAKDIQSFINIKNIRIPRPLLLYWLGLNYALENNVVKSKETLEAFLAQYPDHPYYSDAADLVRVIKESLFKRDTIGCLLPLTGKYAIFGQRALSGIQLAIQELSKKYSRQFKLIIKDTKADPDITIKKIKELNKKNVAGIIGPLLNVNQAGREAQKLKMPIIALTQKSDFPLLGDYLFANFITPEMQVRTLGDYLFSDLDVKKVAILYPDEKYGKKYMKLFWDIVDEYGAKVVGVESYDGRKTDFTEPIQKLTGQFYPVPDALAVKPISPEKNTGVYNDQNMGFVQTGIKEEPVEEKKDEKIQIDFQALFIPDSPSKVNLILPQLAFNDVRDIYLIGTNLWHHKSLLKDARRYNKHAIITDGFFDGSRNPATAGFTQEFEAIYNLKPQFLEAVAYDTASILFLTAMDETVDSRASLKDALRDGRVFKGATGNTVFNKDGTSLRQLFLMTIRKGKFIEISR
ncbi:MAG: penicillin-binding protein activator [Deltaproteobacteria bacterium]|nr:penicillin-binding protein activator [Deltaproteobacteria bacterium]